MRKKNYRILIQMLLSFVFIIAFQLAAFGEGTEEYRLKDMEERGLTDGFSDDEWGAIDIHISISEEAQFLLGPFDGPFNILLGTRGIWWLPRETDWHGSDFPILYDETNGYQLHKELPYRKYVITKAVYTGECTQGHLPCDEYFQNYDYQPWIGFEITEEEPEIPIFIEMKKPEKIFHEELAGKEESHAKKMEKYKQMWDEAEENKTNPYGEVRFHAKPENFGSKYFVVVELEDMGRMEISEIHYFGKSNDYTYTTELAPGLYRIHRAYYIDSEGNILAEDEAVKEYEFEILPQCEAVEINFEARESQIIHETEVVTEKEADTQPEHKYGVSFEMVGNSGEIETAAPVPGIKKGHSKQGQSQRRNRKILYVSLAWFLLAGLAGGITYPILKAIYTIQKGGADTNKAIQRKQLFVISAAVLLVLVLIIYAKSLDGTKQTAAKHSGTSSQNNKSSTKVQIESKPSFANHIDLQFDSKDDTRFILKLQ